MQDHEGPEPEEPNQVHAQGAPGPHPVGITPLGHQLVTLILEGLGIERQPFGQVLLGLANGFLDNVRLRPRRVVQVPNGNARAFRDGRQHVGHDLGALRADLPRQHLSDQRRADLGGKGDQG